jgi:putative colanic acid biosynthesis acetyltransferase WcaF
MLLRAFGASIGEAAKPYPSARIWAPWNLVMEDGSCLGPFVDCYCMATITLERNAIVSQYSYLCAGTHGTEGLDLPLVVAPIRIGENAWVAADVFVGPGVSIGDRSVVGARSTVLEDIPAGVIAAGYPARVIRNR